MHKAVRFKYIKCKSCISFAIAAGGFIQSFPIREMPGRPTLEQDPKRSTEMIEDSMGSPDDSTSPPTSRGRIFFWTKGNALIDSVHRHCSTVKAGTVTKCEPEHSVSSATAIMKVSLSKVLTASLFIHFCAARGVLS